TLPTHQIVGMGEAFAIASMELEQDQQRIKALRERLWRGISALDEIKLNGDPERRVANVLNVGFDYVDGEALLMALQDIAVSTSSACSSATITPSHVLLAMGLSDNLAHSSLRISLGRFTTEAEVDYAIEVITKGVTRLRNLSPLWEERK
ncbi:MAG: aminotransferase class V-fold PLP-dependent enzyme, partial [Pseudomonadota bacterium]|nr:aminotransferase class V-fold PLP-dependent enzyme [Pseudomonadota bacterium]